MFLAELCRDTDAGYDHAVASNQTKDLDKVVTEELLNLHRGQGLDLLWRDTLECPTEGEYIEMVNNSACDPLFHLFPVFLYAIFSP